MSFGTEIFTMIKDDSGVIAAVGSNVFGHKLDDNFDQTSSGILITYNREAGEHSLDKDNVLEIYSLYLTLISPNTETIETIESAIRTLLDDYSSSTIRDLVLEGDTNTPDLEKEQYMKTMRYKAIYDTN